MKIILHIILLLLMTFACKKKEQVKEVVVAPPFQCLPHCQGDSNDDHNGDDDNHDNDRPNNYVRNHSIIPKPLKDSDGHHEIKDDKENILVPFKKNYLSTIVATQTDISRDDIRTCGSLGSIDERIFDCKRVNGIWAFYDGDQYGQSNEGDWALVTVYKSEAGKKYEVWRDERTKLLWSDRSAVKYNWFRASGYAYPDAVSKNQTSYISSPGVVDPIARKILQPNPPISVCPDIIDGKVAGLIDDSGHTPGLYENYKDNPEHFFKGNLSFRDNVIWKLPTINDWQLAEYNGIRKVLPHIEFFHWTASTYSESIANVWSYTGDLPSLSHVPRDTTHYVRCVGFLKGQRG